MRNPKTSYCKKLMRCDLSAKSLNQDILMLIKDADCDPWLHYEPRLCSKGRVNSFHETDLGHQEFWWSFLYLAC
jgi:hypothetical protein